MVAAGRETFCLGTRTPSACFRRWRRSSRTARGADLGPDRTVPVRLAAKMNALGLLQISCVGTDPQTPQSWPLEFNLRHHEQGGAAVRGAPAPAPVAPNATIEAQQA